MERRTADDLSSPAAPTLVLGVESSCDEMAAAIVRDGHEIVASVVHGQEDVHRPYGGVVPELASRDHVRAVSDVAERQEDVLLGTRERQGNALDMILGP